MAHLCRSGCGAVDQVVCRWSGVKLLKAEGQLDSVEAQSDKALDLQCIEGVSIASIFWQNVEIHDSSSAYAMS